MELIFAIVFLIFIFGYFKVQDSQVSNYSRTHRIDYRKVNNDRISNNLSNSQINQNILNGKYDVTKSTKSNNETWEDFKRRHPHGRWN